MIRFSQELGEFAPLFQDTAAERVASQARSVRLLYEMVLPGHGEKGDISADQRALAEVMSEASVVFQPDAVQREIFTSDSGTPAIPPAIRKALVNLDTRLVVRPGTLADLQAFVRWARSENRP